MLIFCEAITFFTTKHLKITSFQKGNAEKTRLQMLCNTFTVNTIQSHLRLPRPSV